MVNFGFNSASILGILLALAGAGLYLLRSLRPEVSRDHDIFFAAVGLLCGGILLWHGWRLDPILQFSQLLLASSAIFFAVESIRLRGFASQQARGRNSSYVDEERPVSRVYRAELEDQEFYEDEYDYPEEQVPRRRLQGTATRSSNSRRRQGYEDESPRRRPSSSSRRYDDDYTQERPSSRTSRRPPSSSRSGWQDEQEAWQDKPSRSSRGYDDYSSSEKPTRRKPRKRRPKSADDIVSSVGNEYVDYQPLDSETENDQPNNETPDNYDY
jgi:hypothetical protein